MHPNMSAIILAAGFSSRMGRFKPLLPLGDKSVLAHTVELFQRAEIGDVRVVAGHRAAELAPIAEVMGAHVIENPQYETGMLSSIKAGIASLPETQEAFFILPVDVPLVRRQSVRDLLGVWGNGKQKILYPTFLDQRGHPPLISTELARQILSWDGDGGLRSFLMRHESDAAGVPVADEYVLFDMDTPGDYQKVLDMLDTYDIPSTRECMTMMKSCFASNKPLFAHCVAVTGVAGYLTDLLNSAGCQIDPRLVRASALLHDMLRSEPDHAAAAARRLREMGYDKVADVVASHMNIHIQEDAPFHAREVVYLADKLVRGDRLVCLSERFGDKGVQFADVPEAKRAVTARFQNALKIRDRFESKTGMSLEAVLSGFSPPAGIGNLA
jgi:molybdenum cofactor cytidylyltransferase